MHCCSIFFMATSSMIGAYETGVFIHVGFTGEQLTPAAGVRERDNR